jgi:hypothetical protein
MIFGYLISKAHSDIYSDIYSAIYGDICYNINKRENMNIGKETEQIEFKKSTSEKKEAMDDVCAILNKHCGGILYFGVKNNGDVVG